MTEIHHTINRGKKQWAAEFTGNGKKKRRKYADMKHAVFMQTWLHRKRAAKAKIIHWKGIISGRRDTAAPPSTSNNGLSLLRNRKKIFLEALLILQKSSNCLM